MKRRVWLLVACLAGLVLVWGLFHRQINQSLSMALFLRSEHPDQELFEELANTYSDPTRYLQRCWAIGKVAHRQLVASYVKDKVVTRPPWLEAITPLILNGTSDADMSVRELSLASLSMTRNPRLFDCAGAQLKDLDPLVRLLGLDYLSKEDRAKALPLVIEMLDDSDLRVVARAEHALTRWTGQDFGVRSRMADEAIHQDESAAQNAEKIRQGVQRRKEWWTAHQNEFAATHAAQPVAESASASRPAVSNFKLYDLNHKPVRLSDFRGRVVLLNFWATWCTACLAEIPDLIALKKQLGDKVAILGVSLDGVTDEHGHDPGEETKDEAHPEAFSLNKVREKVRRAVNSRGINYVVLLDPQNEVGGRFNGGELPTTVIIDPQGRIVRRFIGERSLPVFVAMLAEASGGSLGP